MELAWGGVGVQRHPRVVGLGHAPPHERAAGTGALIRRVNANEDN